MTGSPRVFSDNAIVFCVFFIALAPLAAAGMAAINTGMSRARSAGHAMYSSLIAIVVAALVYFAVGIAVEGFAGGHAHVASIAGKPWDWLAAEKFFFRSLQFDGSPAALAAWLQMLAAAIAALIPVGAGGDRWRLEGTCVSTALLAGIIYPLFGHWTWGGGWLAQLGANFGLGRGFIDPGGSGVIHALGGMTALAICWILGTRRAKHSLGGMPTAVPGHNAILVLSGCTLALVGWTGINVAGTLLFAHSAVESGIPSVTSLGVGLGAVVLAAVNTFLSASAAAASAASTTRLRFGKPDASLTANGWIGGLVASGAGCAFLSPFQAMLTGTIAGVLVVYGVDWLERLTLDDPTGVVSAHALGGMWGLLAVGVFAQVSPGEFAQSAPFTGAGQFLAQLIGVATLLGFVLPLAYAANWAMDRLVSYRVAPEGERLGMDLYELGGGAYPDFAIYDEFSHR
jgi:ammonium transporter, Amt family